MHLVGALSAPMEHSIDCKGSSTLNFRTPNYSNAHSAISNLHWTIHFPTPWKLSLERFSKTLPSYQLSIGHSPTSSSRNPILMVLIHSCCLVISARRMSFECHWWRLTHWHTNDVNVLRNVHHSCLTLVPQEDIVVLNRVGVLLKIAPNLCMLMRGKKHNTKWMINLLREQIQLIW